MNGKLDKGHRENYIISLRKLGIFDTPNDDAELKSLLMQTIVELYRDGATINAISKRVGHSATWTKSWLDRAEEPRRELVSLDRSNFSNKNRSHNLKKIPVGTWEARQL